MINRRDNNVVNIFPYFFNVWDTIFHHQHKYSKQTHITIDLSENLAIANKQRRKSMFLNDIHGLYFSLVMFNFLRLYRVYIYKVYMTKHF